VGFVMRLVWSVGGRGGVSHRLCRLGHPQHAERTKGAVGMFLKLGLEGTDAY